MSLRGTVAYRTAGCLRQVRSESSSHANRLTNSGLAGTGNTSCPISSNASGPRTRAWLTFEWILLITLLAIGIVGGLSAVRDAIIDELGDVAGAAVSVDQSYTVAVDGNTGMGNAFEFVDEAPNFGECDPGRTNVSRSATDDPHRGPNHNQLPRPVSQSRRGASPKRDIVKESNRETCSEANLGMRTKAC